MMAAALLALQAVSSQPADISISAVVDARSARIEKKGTATAKATAEPDGGSAVKSSGSEQSAHWELQIDARIADPLKKAAETTQPEQR